jgi:hypothetical protein
VGTLAIPLRPQIILNKKVINYKVIVLNEIHNFGFGRFSIQGRLKILNFKILELHIQI